MEPSLSLYSSYWDFLPDALQKEIRTYTPHPLTQVLDEAFRWMDNETTEDTILERITPQHIENTSDFLEFFYTLQYASPNPDLTSMSPEQEQAAREYVFDTTFNFKAYKHRLSIYKKFMLLRMPWNNVYVGDYSDDWLFMKAIEEESESAMYSWRDSTYLTKLVWQEQQIADFWINQ